MNDVAMAAFAAPREGGSGTLIFVIQMVAIFAIFYFLLIRPQRKEQERHQEMVDSLEKGHEVITAGGIVGTVIHVDEDRLTVRTGDNTRITIQRSKVSQVLSQKDDDS